MTSLSSPRVVSFCLPAPCVYRENAKTIKLAGKGGAIAIVCNMAQSHAENEEVKKSQRYAGYPVVCNGRCRWQPPAASASALLMAFGALQRRDR